MLVSFAVGAAVAFAPLVSKNPIGVHAPRGIATMSERPEVLGRRATLLAAAAGLAFSAETAHAQEAAPAFEPPPVALARLVSGDTVKAAADAKAAAKLKSRAADDAKDAKEARLAAAKEERERKKAELAAARAAK